MTNKYTITLDRVNEYDLVVTYSEELKSASHDDLSIALEDCIKTLQNHLLLLQQT